MTCYLFNIVLDERCMTRRFILVFIQCLCQGASTLDNINEWEWKLTMLLRNKDEQEVVSREKKDRRDFDQLSALATRMGLYRYIRFLLLHILSSLALQDISLI